MKCIGNCFFLSSINRPSGSSKTTYFSSAVSLTFEMKLVHSFSKFFGDVTKTLCISKELSSAFNLNSNLGFSLFSLICSNLILCFYCITATGFRLNKVRDCGLLSCPPTLNFKRDRMLVLLLKPLLYLAFVSIRNYLILNIFLKLFLVLTPFLAWLPSIISKNTFLMESISVNV